MLNRGPCVNSDQPVTATEEHQVKRVRARVFVRRVLVPVALVVLMAVVSQTIGSLTLLLGPRR